MRNSEGQLNEKEGREEKVSHRNTGGKKRRLDVEFIRLLWHDGGKDTTVGDCVHVIIAS